jgi:organic radical activating enzyme
MKTYNYEARNEDKQNNYLEPHPEDLKYYKQNNYPKSQLEEPKPIPVYEQLTELEYAIEKLSSLQGSLIERLEWVSKPCDRPVQEQFLETKANSERPESEIVRRIEKSVQNIKELQYRLSIQLEELDV